MLDEVISKHLTKSLAAANSSCEKLCLVANEVLKHLSKYHWQVPANGLQTVYKNKLKSAYKFNGNSSSSSSVSDSFPSFFLRLSDGFITNASS